MSSQRVVLVACGSFNPITNKHLRNFELARDYLHRTGRFQVVGGIISPVNNGYGKKGLVSAKHRCAMVDAALKTNDWIRLDSWECEQDSWLETVKVLRHHQSVLDASCLQTTSRINTPNIKKQKLDLDNLNVANQMQNNMVQPWDLGQPIQIKFLCGADLLESFSVPGLWDPEDITELVSKYGLVIITREGFNPSKFIYESDILSRFQHNIHIVTEWIENDISSTHIRRAVRRGESIKYLVPDSVILYMKNHTLYQEQEKN